MYMLWKEMVYSSAFCVLSHFLVASAPKQANWKGLLSGKHMSQVFQDSHNSQCVSNFSHQPQKCSLYFNIFVSKCITQSDSQTQGKKITKQLPVVLSVIIFKILEHSSQLMWQMHVKLVPTLASAENMPLEGFHSSWRSPLQSLKFSLSLWMPAVLFTRKLKVKKYFS